MAERRDQPARVPMSLEKKLPLMMTAVLLLIIGVGVTLAYRYVNAAAQQVAQERVKQVATQLADLLAAGGPRNSKILGTVATDPAVIASLTVSESSKATVSKATEALDNAVAAGDSGVGTALISTNGRVVASARTSDMGPAWTEGIEQDLSRSVNEGISTGPFYESDRRIFYTMVYPVVSAGVRLGSVIQHRRLNANAATEQGIAGLTGQDVGIFLRNADGSHWLTLGGKPVPPPSNPRTVSGMKTFDHPGMRSSGRVLLEEAPVKGMPWVVVLELPLKAITAAPRAMLRQFMLVSILLLIAGALATWLICRRVTAPLGNLTRAADAIAGGDYSQRVDSTGDREIVQLADTFNQMARGTAAAHRALEDRFREARSLAEELEHANRRLRATTDAAEEAQLAAETANAAKSSFLAAMSHELRTPLNAISGYVQLIEMGLRGPVTPEQHADLHRIKRSHAYLLGLIEDVLNFAKLDAHQMEFHTRDVPVEEIMHDVETLLAPQLDTSGITYSYEKCDSRVAVRADPDKTQQILINLVANAVKFTRPPGSVVVSCDSTHDTVEISVRDTGIGIKPEDMSRVFEPFVQIGRGLSQPGEGVGLGLTISRDFAQRMRGDLIVQSKVGEGSTFTLLLPRAEDVALDGSSSNSGTAAAVAG
ncbi:MAG: ATP-binding protein [Gemmatimonadaceae bacterium]